MEALIFAIMLQLEELSDSLNEGERASVILEYKDGTPVVRRVDIGHANIDCYENPESLRGAARLLIVENLRSCAAI